MKEKLKNATKIALAGCVVGGMAILVSSDFSFKNHEAGVMTIPAAAQLGLFPKKDAADAGPFGPKSLWFATRKDGGYDYRVSWPFIGLIPFDIFYSGTTKQDLVSACRRLGQSQCLLSQETLNK